MYSIEFIIPDLPKTYNQLGRAHWTVKNKEAKKWIKAIGQMTLGKIPSQPLIKAKITLTRVSASSPDSDGLVSSFKHVIDGLRHARVIINDTYDIIGMPEYKWEKGKRGKGFIKVRIEEI